MEKSVYFFLAVAVFVTIYSYIHLFLFLFFSCTRAFFHYYLYRNVYFKWQVPSMSYPKLGNVLFCVCVCVLCTVLPFHSFADLLSFCFFSTLAEAAILSGPKCFHRYAPYMMYVQFICNSNVDAQYRFIVEYHFANHL